MPKRAKNELSNPSVVVPSSVSRVPVPLPPAKDRIYNDSSPVRIAKTKINGRPAIESTRIARGMQEDSKFAENHLNNPGSDTRKLFQGSKSWKCVQTIKAAGSRSEPLYTALVTALNCFSRRAYSMSLFYILNNSRQTDSIM